MTRLDIKFTVNQLSRFSTKPEPNHIKYLYQVVQYLNNTRHLNQEFEESPNYNHDHD